MQTSSSTLKGRGKICSTGGGLPPVGLAPPPSSAVLIEGVDGARRAAAFIIRGLHDEGIGAGDDYSDVRGRSKVGIRQGTIG